MRVVELPEGGPGAGASGKLPIRNRRTAIQRTIVRENPRMAIYVHRILRADPSGSVPHSHPRRMLTICLRGGYLEELWREGMRPRQRRHRRFLPYFLPTDIHHMITEVAPRTVTVCLMGRERAGVNLWWQGRSWTWKEWVSR